MVEVTSRARQAHRLTRGPTAPRTGSVRRVLAAVSAAGVCLALAACERTTAVPGRLIERSQLAMGSELRLSAWTDDEPAALTAFEDVFGEFTRLDAILSVWRDGSDVRRINDAAGGDAIDVEPETVEVLLVARQISEWTGGKFDVTFAALSDIWKFDHDQDNRIPAAEAIARRLPLIDYRALTVNVPARTVQLVRRGMKVHLGGIGKGYAIDRAVARMRRRGLTDFMIQSGGDLYVAGRRGDRPWRVGIRDPHGPPDRVVATLDLADGTFSTSGDYERAFVKDGVRYHHILDPDTGMPARGAHSVTITAASAAIADGLSTGVFLLGPKDGMALIERLPGIEGVIVTADNQVLVSSGLKDALHLADPPTAAP